MSSHIEPKNIFVVIPAYNEQGSLPSVIKDLGQYHYSIVVVDDGSAESLLPSVRQLPLYFLRHEVNLGQGAAIQTGIEFALEQNAQYIVSFDADGQHKAEDIDNLIMALVNKKTDIVLGSRFMEDSAHNITAGRKLLLQLARLFNYAFTGLFLTDAHNGLRAMTADSAQKITLKENGMAHATEILLQIKKAGLRYTETPVHIYYSEYSKSKGQSAWNSFRIFFDIVLNKIFK